MGNSREETIRVGGEINPFDGRLQIQHCPNEGGILVTEPVMLLTGPSARLDVIETADVLSPFCFLTNLDEFRVLNHHCMYNP